MVTPTVVELPRRLEPQSPDTFGGNSVSSPVFTTEIGALALLKQRSVEQAPPIHNPQDSFEQIVEGIGKIVTTKEATVPA